MSSHSKDRALARCSSSAKIMTRATKYRVRHNVQPVFLAVQWARFFPPIWHTLSPFKQSVAWDLLMVCRWRATTISSYPMLLEIHWRHRATFFVGKINSYARSTSFSNRDMWLPRIVLLHLLIYRDILTFVRVEIFVKEWTYTVIGLG